jgi:uncharacterized membrane protein YozB (DUF420 family)
MNDLVAPVFFSALWGASPHPLATTNAALNFTAMVLLLVGYALIKARKEAAHKWTMLSAFGVSVAFLASYLTYHFAPPPVGIGGSVPFTGTGPVRIVYFTILATHILLAAIVPVLALMTIYRGLKDQREKHRRLARWTFPIWLYVSVTGVVIYVMLYHLYPAP